MLNGAAGYQSDSATGLQLLGHRYYDPSIGRFLSSDPAQAGTNWYAYCDNNPLIHSDRTGLQYPDEDEGDDDGYDSYTEQEEQQQEATDQAEVDVGEGVVAQSQIDSSGSN